MGQKARVVVRTREKAAGLGEKAAFQSEVVPNETISGEELYKRLAERSGFTSSQMQLSVMTIEGFVKEELAKGNRIDFGLVSFLPRLAKGLPARDADPVSEGIGVRGSVRVRSELRNCIGQKLEPVNELSNVRPRILGVCDAETKEPDVVRADRVLEITGRDIPIDASRPDEGVWLETRARGKVAVAEVLESSAMSVKCVFHEVPDVCKRYTLVVGTRCGKGTDFRIRRCLADVRVA